VKLFVDTSVWSLALRRDRLDDTPEVSCLRDALERGAPVYTTGLVLQELLQGFTSPKAHQQIVARLTALPFVVPDPGDHVAGADLRNRCRRRGVQVTTIDAVLAQLCIRHDLTMLSTDQDFARIAGIRRFGIWRP